jgi:hypothetical protein
VSEDILQMTDQELLALKAQLLEGVREIDVFIESRRECVQMGLWPDPDTRVSDVPVSPEVL